MKITGNIITLNESKNIKKCIDSLKKVCDEVIVVDSYSEDNTVELAKSLGVRVVLQEYLGDGPQKNVVIEYAKYDWILSIDADERLDDLAIQEILKLKRNQSNNFDSYSFKRKNYIGDRWIEHCGWYPDVCIRLYKHSNARFKNVLGHSYVESHNISALEGNIIHHSFKDYYDLFYKLNRFSTRGANMFLMNDKKVNSASPLIHGVAAFIRKYVFKKGFLQGLDGLTISISTSINSYLKYAKYIELKKHKINSKDQSIWK
jgi:glycosyltransferase involved in cell wall biosynthesis